MFFLDDLGIAKCDGYPGFPADESFSARRLGIGILMDLQQVTSSEGRYCQVRGPSGRRAIGTAEGVGGSLVPDLGCGALKAVVDLPLPFAALVLPGGLMHRADAGVGSEGEVSL